MKNSMLLFLIILSVVGGNCTSDKNSFIVVEGNGNLMGKIYYNTEGYTTSIVSFSESLPIDSVYFLYDSSNKLKYVKDFEFDNGFKEVDNSESTKYYEDILNGIDKCTIYEKLNFSNILINEINDLCNISTSTLADGRSMKDLEKIKVEGNNMTVTYSNINFKFNNLSLYLQSFLYDQEINKIVVHIKNNRLNSEEYFLNNGIISRRYLYEDNKVKSIIITDK